MSIIKRYSPLQNLSEYQTFLVDDAINSRYFKITEFKETLTGGKNGFLIEGSPYLKETTEVKIEVLDVEGNPIYVEPGNGGTFDYYEGTSILVSMHVYDDTPIGIGTVTILAEAKTYINDSGAVVDVPDEWKGSYNIKWERDVKINKLLLNEDKVRFYQRPLVSINEIVKPIFNITTDTVVQSGTVTGIPQIPVANTNLSSWSAGVEYKLNTTDSFWISSIVGNTINVDVNGTPYSPTVTEVLNNRNILVNIPYTENSIVLPFTASPYTASFDNVEGQILSPSVLSGSFADINISRLRTFVGDVARVKIFRKSRNDAGEYQLLQDLKLESDELLIDYTTTTDNQISYGIFNDSNLSNYWLSGSNSHPITIDNSILQNSAFVDYNTGAGGVQTLETSGSIDILKGVEYTLSFKCKLNGTVDSNKTLRAYLSSSLGTQLFKEITATNEYLQQVVINENIIGYQDDSMKLVFEFVGDDWYISNVSLRNSAETSFSPDAVRVIQTMPRFLQEQIFDFRFEFYDINNNYIPVDIKKSHTFNLGNDYGNRPGLDGADGATGPSGSAGLNAKAVSLTTTDYVISYLADGTTPSPSGTLILSGSSQNLIDGYFKFTGEGSYTDGISANFSTGSYTIPSTYFSTPVSLRVGVADGDQNELAFDTITIAAVKPGNSGDSSEFYYIKPLSGTQLKNSQGNLELQAVYVSGSTSTDLSSGDVKLYSGSVLLSSVGGITNGGNGIDYNPILDNTDINGTLVVALKDASLNVLDTITLLDVTDGIAGGTVISSNLKTNRVNTGTVAAPIWGYTPPLLFVTGSFYGTDGIEYTSDLVLSASYVGSLDELKYTLGNTDGTILVVVDDGDGGIMTNNVSTATKDAHITYTFTDPNTSAVVSTSETFYIVSDGQDGYDAMTFILTNDSHTLATTNTGVVTYTGSGTIIRVYEGNTELVYDGVGTSNSTWKVTATPTNIVVGTITDSGNFATVGVHNSMTEPSASISYLIEGNRFDGTSFSATKIQSLTKSIAGADGVNGSSGSNAHVVSLTATKYTVPYNENGNIKDGTDITFTATSQNITSPQYQFLRNGAEVRTWSGTATYLYPTSDTFPGPASTDLIQVNARSGTGATLAFDNVDVFGLSDATSGSDGVDGYTVFLTNEVHTFAAPVSGYVGIDYAGSEFEVRVFKGTTPLTYAASGVNTYSITSIVKNEITSSESTVSSQRKFTPTEISADQGTITFDIVDNTTATTFSKVYTFGVSRVGVAGVDGNGFDWIFYSSSLATIPSTPTAVGNPVGWTDAPSGVDITNKYEYTSFRTGSDSSGWSLYNTPTLWAKFSEDGTNGSAGLTAKSVSLTTSNYVISYDSDGTNPTPSGTLILSGSSQNLSNGYFKFTGEGSYTDGISSNFSTGSYTIPSTYFSTPVSLRVGVADGDQNELAFDTITIAAVKPGSDGNSGSDAYTVLVTNDSHTIPSDNDGSNPVYTGSGTNIIVYKGATKLTGVSSGVPGTNQFSASAALTTGANISISNGVPYTISSQEIVYADHSGASWATDVAVITYTIYLENGVDTVAKTQTLGKSKKGNTGDGTQYSYYDNNSATAPVTDPGAGGTSNGWTLTPTGVTVSNQYEWIKQRTSTNGVYGSWSSPAALFSKYGVIGDTGKRVATGYVFYTTPSVSTPGAPTTGPWDDDYDFTTGLITGLTGDWSNSPPVATGNGEYWYAKYHVEEGATTDKGTPIFSTTAVNYSFTDLVTFTNLSTSGSTTIDGGNIATGKIQSTNWSTTQGGQWDISNGKLILGGSDNTSITDGEGIYMEATTAGTPKFRVGSTTNYIRYDGSSIEINTANFDIAANGDVTISGNVTATTGVIGGFTLGNTQLYTGTKSTLASTAAGVYIGTDGIALGASSPFKVDVNGALTATSGTIGGWTIGTSALSSGDITLNTVGPEITLGSNITISPDASLDPGFSEQITGASSDTIVRATYSTSTSGSDPYVVNNSAVSEKLISATTITAGAGSTVVIASIDPLEMVFDFICGKEGGITQDYMQSIDVNQIDFYIKLGGTEYAIGSDNIGTITLEEDLTRGQVKISSAGFSSVSFDLTAGVTSATITLGYRFNGGIRLHKLNTATLTSFTLSFSDVIMSGIKSTYVSQQTRIDDGGMIMAVSGNKYFIVSGSSTPNAPYIQSVGKWIHNGTEIGTTGGAGGGSGTSYVHPTTAGFKHIPAGGASGNFLAYSSDGTATWATPSYFTTANARTSISLTTTGTSGASTYSSGTGVLNIPNYTLAGLGYSTTRSIVNITGTKAEFDTAVTDGNFMYIGDAPTAHTHTFASLTSKPTLVSGSSQIDHDQTTNFVANEHLDWTVDLGATNIHAGNYTNTQLSNAQVIAMTLTGFTSFGSVSAVAAADSIFTAFRKLEYRVNLNDSKVSNVTTDLSATITTTTVTINSSDGTNAIIGTADGFVAGVLSTTLYNNIITNNSKVSNVTTNLSTTTSATTITINSSDGTNAVIGTANGSVAGVLSTTLYNNIITNNSKASNVTTDLSTSTSATTVTINSSDGTNATIDSANGSAAGILTNTLYNNIITNNSKVSNVTTDLSTSTSATTVTINSSDGTDAIIGTANSSNAGIMTTTLYDYVIANNSKVSNVTTDLSTSTSGTTVTINSSDGTDAVISAASETTAGIVTNGSQIWAGAKTFTSNPRLYENGVYSAELEFQNNTHTMGIDYENTETLRFITRSGGVTVPITFQMRSGSITASGEITAYSDGRLKDVICETPSVLDTLMKVNVVDYTRNDQDNGKVRTGVIAQELRETFPQYVSGNEENEMLSVNYAEMVSICIKAIQELRDEIKQLKNNK